MQNAFWGYRNPTRGWWYWLKGSHINLKTKVKERRWVNGIHFNKEINKWVASIKFMKKYIYLGNYADIDDAIKARKEAEQELWSTKNG